MTITVNKNTLVIFDLDDTLYAEYDFLYSAFEEVASMMNGDTKQVHELMLKWYAEKEDVFSKLLHSFPDSSFNKNDLLQCYRNHIPGITLANGAVELLNNLKSHDIKMALITDGRSITQRNKIYALELNSFFDRILISEETGHEKITGAPFRILQATYPGYSVIVFGDNVNKDFHWPKQFGWQTIGLRNRGKNIHSQENKENSVQPDQYIDSFADLTVTYE